MRCVRGNAAELPRSADDPFGSGMRREIHSGGGHLQGLVHLSGLDMRAGQIQQQ